MQKIFYIPEKIKYVIVSDMFVKDYIGGAELTMDAILNACPDNYFEIKSSAVTPELIQKYKTKYWILGNFTHMTHDALIELVINRVKYSIIECDYKYCKFRSSHLHKLQTKEDCNCHKEKFGRFINALFNKAHKVFFMSEAQKNEYTSLFPETKHDNYIIQTSTFKSETLVELSKLRQMRNYKNIIPKYTILQGGSWIKAQKETIEWAQKNNIDFELIGGLPPEQFLQKLAEYKGLIFRPAGFDTCPRLVLEAKLLGLDLKLNNNVQHSNESWFCASVEECENYLQTRQNAFWSEINE